MPFNGFYKEWPFLYDVEYLIIFLEGNLECVSFDISLLLWGCCDIINNWFMLPRKLSDETKKLI